MSSYQPTHPPGPGERPSASPQAGQPPSFKTNVNRNKTKRWVNAKSESYDGDDWGSSGDEESDEDTPDVPPVPGGHSANQPNPTARTTTSAAIAYVQKAPTAGTEGQDTHSGAHPQPQIVRPADIYKRMAHGREQQQQQQPPSQSTQSEDPAPVKPEQREQPQAAQLPELGNFSSSFGHDFMGGESGYEPTARKPAPEPEKPSDPQTSEGELHHNPSLGFRSVVNQAFDAPDTPDSLARSNSESTTQISPIIRSGTGTQEARPAMTDAPPTIEEEPTDRRDSMPQDFRPGFRRSLTPPSSDHTPSHRPVVSESSPPPAQSEIAQVAETPASVPSASMNKESPRPELTVVTKPDDTSSAPSSRPASHATRDSDAARGGAQLQGNNVPHSAETGTDRQSREAPAAPPPKGDGNSEQNSNASPAKDHQQVVRGVSDEHQDSPTNSDALSPDSVNDRLREAIMQSLSPSAPQSASDMDGPSKSDETSDPPQGPGSSSHRQSTQMSSDYDRYWHDRPSDRSAGPPPLSARGPPAARDKSVSEERPSESESHSVPVSATRTQTAEREDSQPSRPHLKKKFSWEADSSDEGDSSQPVTQNQGRGDQQSKTVELTAAERDVSPAVSIPSVGGSPSDSEPDELQDIGDSKGDPPRYSTIQPRKANAEERHVAPADGNNVQTREPERTVDAREPLAADTTLVEDTQATQTQLRSPHKRIPGFREILSMEGHDEKLTTFNEARDQFATTDTGLDTWIQYVAETLPEHTDVIALNGQVPSDANLYHKAMHRSKFPKFSSLGTLSIPSSHQDGTGKSSHARQPSNSGSNNVAHSQQVQARGKDLLHSAGVLGGKAGGAAKGLLAKGRNRLRNTGSGDKDPSQTPPHGDTHNQSPYSGGIDSAQPSRAVTPRSHVDRYERPLPPLPSSSPAVVTSSGYSDNATTGLAAVPATDSAASVAESATQSYPVPVPSQASIPPEQSSAGDQQIEQSGFHSETAANRAFGDANRRSSPVSTLGMTSDTSWRGNGGYWWETGSRRESVSTLGMSGHTPSLDLPRPWHDKHPDGDKTPTPQATLQNTIEDKEPGHAFPGGVEISPASAGVADQDYQPGTRGDLGLGEVSTRIPHGISASSGKENDNSGHGGLSSGIGHMSGEAEASSNVSSSSSVIARPALASDGDDRPVVPPKQPPKQPPTVMDGSQYQRVLAKSLGMPVTSANTSGSPVNDRQEKGVPTQQSSNQMQSGGQVSSFAWQTVDDVRTSAIPSSDRNPVAQGPGLAQHSAPTAQQYPSSDKQNKPTNGRPTVLLQSVRNSSPDVPSQSALPHQSRAGFSGFVSKLQSGLQRESKSAESSPIAGKEKNSRLRTAASDVRKRSSLNIQPRAKQEDEPALHPGQSKQPGRETPPIEDSKKATIHKVLGRRSQTGPQADDGEKTPHSRVTALLGKPARRASPEKKEESPPIAEYYAPQLRPARYSDNLQQFQGVSHTSGPQPHPAPRPGRGRYYQSAGAQQGGPDNGLSGTYSQRHSSPFFGQEHYNRAVQPRTQSRTKPTPPRIDTDVHGSGAPYNNTRALLPSHQDGQGNLPAYITKCHVRSQNSLQMSPVRLQSESANNNDGDPAYDPGIFYTATPRTRRVGDQTPPSTVTENNGQQRDKNNKQLPPNMSPDSISGYPLPESNVISPVNPATSGMPPPSPPKNTLQKPNTFRAMTARTAQAALATPNLPSRNKSHDIAIQSRISCSAANKESPLQQQRAVPTIPASNIFGNEQESTWHPARSRDDDIEKQPHHPTTAEALDNRQAEQRWREPHSQSIPAVRNRKQYPASETIPRDSPHTPTTAVPDDIPVKGMGPQARPSQSAEIAELPAKVTGDESSEEIVMSSTAYPGQEWYPEYVEDSD